MVELSKTHMGEPYNRPLELEKTIRDAMDSASLKTIRRFADRSKRWLTAYTNELSKEQREVAEKQYKSRRREYCQAFV